jgi:hypothetical protein
MVISSFKFQIGAVSLSNRGIQNYLQIMNSDALGASLLYELYNFTNLMN